MIKKNASLLLKYNMTKSQYDHKIIGLGHITNNTVNNVSQYVRAPSDDQWVAIK